MTTTLIISFSLIFLIIGIWKISDPSASKARFILGIISLISSFVLPTIFSFSQEEITLNIVALVTFLSSAIIILQGIIIIPNNPITIAVITRLEVIKWKKATEKDKDEKKVEVFEIVTKEHGYRFVFLKGILYDTILIPIVKINVDLPAQKVTTPKDNAESEVPVSYTYTPGPNFFNYLSFGPINKGLKKVVEVENVLNDKIQEELRIWASSHQEGPKTWEDLRGSGDEGTAVLIDMIAGEELKPIPCSIPPLKLFQFYGKIPFYSSQKQEEIEEEKKKIKEELASLDETEIKKAVNDRWDFIKKIRKSNGTQVIDSLGITINRLNIGQIKVDPKIQEANTKQATEAAEKIAEGIEFDHIKASITKLMFDEKEKGVLVRNKITEQQAIEIIQSERGKVPKTINVDKKEISLNKESADLVAQIAIAILTGKKGGES